MLVMGGYDGNYVNDIWSSIDGASWSLVTANADWTGRRSHTSVVHGNQIFIMTSGPALMVLLGLK